MTYRHFTIHARPPGATLAISSSELVAPFAISFEQAVANLARLERLDCEPDGAFTWFVGSDTDWQIDGHLYDRNERLIYVDIKGACPADRFDQLLAALGWPETPLVFQLQREAVILDEREFRRIAYPG